MISTYEYWDLQIVFPGARWIWVEQKVLNVARWIESVEAVHPAGHVSIRDVVSWLIRRRRGRRIREALVKFLHLPQPRSAEGRCKRHRHGQGDQILSYTEVL